MDSEKLKLSTTTDGKPPRPGFEEAGAPAPIDPKTGQHESYWVLSEEERAKGFVRPVRTKYVHIRCGSETRMGVDIAQTYARDPHFYGATFCCYCGKHFPLKDADGPAFLWPDGEPVGSTEEEAKAHKALIESQHGKRSADCPGRFKCHGPASWCDVCGDVDLVCDDPECMAHPRGEELHQAERLAREELMRAESEYKSTLKHHEECERALRRYNTGNVVMVARGKRQ